jgi:hypothetical protein
MFGPMFMGFRIISMATRGFGNAMQGKGSPKGSRNPIGWVGVVPVIIFGIIFIIHGPTVGLFVVAVLVLSPLVAIGMLMAAPGGSREATRKLEDMPDPLRPPTPDAMRARARELKVAGSPAPRGVPQPVQQVMSRDEILADRDRLLRVAGILGVSCPVCGRMRNTSCAFTERMSLVELDEGRCLYAHDLRIQKSVQTGSATREDVIAQFDGNIPEHLMVALL